MDQDQEQDQPPRPGDDRLRMDFDHAAADFDRLSPLLWDRLAESTLAVSAPAPGERVLDACCGTGASALPTARRVGSTGRVDAVDTSAAMVAGLRRRAAELDWLEPARADVTGWEGGGYDLVQCVMGIFFLHPMQTQAARLARLTHGSGRAVFTIWREGAMEVPGRALVDAVAAVRGEAAPTERPNPLARLGTVAGYTRWLSELDSGEVRVLEQDLSVVLDEEVAWLLVTGSGFVEMLRGLTVDQVAEVRGRYLSRLLPEGQVDGGHLVSLVTR